MTQRNIQHFFSNVSNEDTSSDSSDSEAISLPLFKDVAYYQELINRQLEMKKITKVIVNSAAISECWKYFGDLYIKDRRVLDKFKFCKLCLESESMTLKR